MNNLTTRKIVLGLLMTLVLALGAQGTAEAVNVPAGTSQRKAYSAILDINAPFTAFTVALDQNTLKESVRITTNGGAQLTVGGVRSSSLTLTEKDTNADDRVVSAVDGVFYSGNTQLTASVTIAGYFTNLGKRTITITDTTPSSTDPAYERQDPVTYTYYVVKPDSEISPTDTIRLTRGGSAINSQGYITRVDGRNDFYIQSGSSDYRVTYTLVPAASNLYIKALDGSTNIPVDSSPIPSRIRVWLDANGSGISAAETYVVGPTNVVTATIGGTNVFKAAYISGTPTLGITITADTNVTPNPTAVSETTDKPARFTGGTAGQNAGTIQATVTDGTEAPVPDVVVKFDVVDKGIRGGYLSSATGLVGTIVNDKNRVPTSSPPTLARTLYVRTDDVRTDDSGQATLTYEMGTASGRQRITLTAVGLPSKEVTAELTSSGVSSKKLAKESNQRQTENSKKFDLIALVTEDDDFVEDQTVTFETDNGSLSRVSAVPDSGEVTTDEEINVVTNALGEAHVVYDIGDNTGRQEIRATIVDGGDRQSVTFVVNGGSGSGDPDPPPVTTRGSLNISVSGTGTTRTVTVTASRAGTAAPGISVILNVNNGATLSRTSGGSPLTSTLTLPATAGDYTLTATTTADYTGDSETITVTLPGTLSLELVGSENNGAHTLQVIVRNAAGTQVTTPVRVSLSGAGISRPVTVTGSGNVPIALPTTAATLTASATGYNSGTLPIPARTTTPGTAPGPGSQPPADPDPEPPAAPEPSRITIVGSATRSDNTANQQLDSSLLVQVLDDDGDAVEDVRVIFRVREGQGRLQEKGNGRATVAETDARGHARATYTPMSASSTVEAEARGVTRTVTFTITTGAAPATDTTGTAGSYKAGDKIPGTLSRTFSGKITINGQTYTCTSSGECVISNGFVTKGQIEVSGTTTPGTSGTPRATEINPVVQVNAANRPPMLWVDGGSIYALVGKDVQKFVPSVDTALNIAIGGDKVYWTEKTGASAGTINSANLNGSDVKELASIMAVPMGIAVDTAGSKLYWTNSRGRIQSANLDGSQITNVLQDLPGPMDIALNRGIVYWTQYDATKSEGAIGLVNPSARGVPKTISTGMDSPGSLVIGGTQIVS